MSTAKLSVKNEQLLLIFLSSFFLRFAKCKPECKNVFTFEKMAYLQACKTANIFIFETSIYYWITRLMIVNWKTFLVDFGILREKW